MYYVFLQENRFMDGAAMQDKFEAAKRKLQNRLTAGRKGSVNITFSSLRLYIYRL